MPPEKDIPPITVQRPGLFGRAITAMGSLFYHSADKGAPQKPQAIEITLNQSQYLNSLSIRNIPTGWQITLKLRPDSGSLERNAILTALKNLFKTECLDQEDALIKKQDHTVHLDLTDNPSLTNKRQISLYSMLDSLKNHHIITPKEHSAIITELKALINHHKSNYPILTPPPQTPPRP